MGTRGSLPGVKRPGREADHSSPSSAKVKNAWSYTSTPPGRLHGMWLFKSTGAPLFLYSLPTSKTVLGSNQPSVKSVRGGGVLFRRRRYWTVKLTTHSHLLLKHRIRGFSLPRHLYNFMTRCLGTISVFQK
jgi:hypothetical protein